ncbi:DUF2163 domain-containing protein [Aliihoeflea aestuarii]|jgi:uncharacterized phage protein (TIGR02218 family)|uniref:DUF2163 domain-containing protein n=1 Tax=Aliihoeflea aestuarii TaxID=453840 RepID=UPI002092781F|nr:DUF2163 domain-containing protein [Aliihoeflea aestuarii]MCO6389502.1 DUF2163 domain-containing protein [Aliihoeflea aestuarii]
MSDMITTFCFCWRVTKTDGQVLGFTDHDRRLDFQDTPFEPQSGFSQSEAQSSLGLAVDTAEIEGALSSDRLSEQDIDAGLFDGAKVETFKVDWRDPDAAKLIRVSAIGKIIRRDGTLVAELESLTRNLDRPAGRYLRRSCDAELGDVRCGVQMSGASMMAQGTVIARQGDATYEVAGLDGFADGWFTAGHLKAGSMSVRVTNHRRATAGVLVSLAKGRELEAGAVFSIRVGCDKSFATCRDKFSNTANFRGFPHLPGNDAAYGYVNEDGVFDGGAFVP